MNPKQLKYKDVAKVREDILYEQQEGVCAICEQIPKRPALDHSHVKKVKGTGLIRGVLCSSCNVFLAKSENNCVRYGFTQKELPSILRNVANYLEGEHYPLIHPSEAPKRKILKKSSYNKLKKAYDGKAKFPVYTEKKKNKNSMPKPNQILTKPLERLFIKYNIEPEFYK